MAKPTRVHIVRWALDAMRKRRAADEGKSGDCRNGRAGDQSGMDDGVHPYVTKLLHNLYSSREQTIKYSTWTR